jgi:hypothetical protein
MARHHGVVWVEDPYQLLEEADVVRLEEALAKTGHKLALVPNALRLAEVLDSFEGGPHATRAVIVDRSYSLRDAYLLPKDARPCDLRPLPAPEWKPALPKDAFFRPNVRDFLVSATGMEDWPVQVNIFPYEKIARERPNDLVRAYETFRRMGRALTDDELVIIGASAVFGVDLFDIARPLVALELAFHAQLSWNTVAELFNAREQEVIRRHLRTLARPLRDLFGEHAETARTAVVALLVLKQHFPEDPGQHLRFLSPALAPYRDCDVVPCAEVPSWFMETEIPRFEQMCGKDFLDHLHDALGLRDPTNRRLFAQRERLSAKLRGLVPFEIDVPTGGRETGDQDFRLERLVPEFVDVKRELEKVVCATGRTIENLRLRPLKNQTAKDLLQVFVDGGFYRIDVLEGRLRRLQYFIECPAHRQWTTVPGFEERWKKEVDACRKAMTLARDLRDKLDVAFGTLLEARYSEIVPSEVLTTDLFYEKFIGPRRRTATAAPRKAVVLVIDSMRLDIWRELVRPALERDYEVEEWIGFSLLPSETRVSRRAFFAGKPPAAMPSSGRESELFAELLASVHGTSVVFEELSRRPNGMSFGVRSRDGTVYAGVFDFPDALTHEVDWDPHVLHDAQRPLLRELRALLADVGPEALVFITADHGHVLQERGLPVWIEGSDDVGYRAAYVRERIQGNDAAHVFQLPARVLRHAAPGWYVFPRPGYALCNAADRSRRFRPTGTYRHGGLSLWEVVVPIACLRHRATKPRVSLHVCAAEPPVVGRTTMLEVRVSADGILALPVSLTSDHAAVEGSVVGGVTTMAKTVRLRFQPTAPGRQRVQIFAELAGEKVGEASVELQVAAAEAEPDVARAKLAKLFGDEG